MKPRKERATKQLRIYPSTYEKLRTMAFKRRTTLAAVIREMIASA